jgi:ribosomal-protein-alanine N-acetyltransferase
LEGPTLTPQPNLETARLRVRAFVGADAPAVQRLAGARQIADTTLTVPHPYPDGAAEAWIATHGPAWQDRTGVTYAITAADGALLGAIGLALTPAHAVAELGYWVAVPAWGRGYATEAAVALCDFAFGVLGVHRIQVRHLTRNPASGRVMQKLGMQREGILRDAVRKWDRFEDLALYAVLAPEWQTVRPSAMRRS